MVGPSFQGPEMPVIFSAASREDLFKNWSTHWPGKEQFANPHDVRRDQYEALKGLVQERGSETAIEEFLSRNAEVLALVMSLFSTGHHASWLYPKLQISPPSGRSGGLIPDYVLAGASSDGVSWFVLELKGANHDAFSSQNKRVFLSGEANRGVCQLLDYINSSSRSQGYLRDELRLNGFREPRGILLIGTEEETADERVRSFKGAWNRINPRLQIRSYNSLLRTVERKLHDFRR